MPGGCWVCNPMCGKCQPAPMKSAECPKCGAVTVFERAQVLAGENLGCMGCGLDLSEAVRPEVIRCNYSGKLCAYPCGKGTAPRLSRSFQPCERTTPPSNEWLADHPDALRNHPDDIK